MAIDLDRLRREARRLQPKLITLAGSLCLFPYAVREAREIADEVGAYLLYDAAHMGGVIAGGRFQQPLAEGAHLMTLSTYKAYGGPPPGLGPTTEKGRAARPSPQRARRRPPRVRCVAAAGVGTRSRDLLQALTTG